MNETGDSGCKDSTDTYNLFLKLQETKKSVNLFACLSEELYYRLNNSSSHDRFKHWKDYTLTQIYFQTEDLTEMDVI